MSHPPPPDLAPPASRHDPERRRRRRLLAGELRGRVGFAQPLRVIDLSADGARVRTAESLSPRRRYHLQLAGVHVTAAVARCALIGLEPDDEGARPVFEAGLAFDPLAPPQRRALRKLLATLPPAAAGDGGGAVAAG
jgi:hypothetical protein